MMKTLEELSVSKGEYGGGFSAVERFNGAPRYVRITDITSEGGLNDDIKAPSGEIQEWQKYILKEGDLLFARSGATVGKTFLYKNVYGPCIYAGYLIRFRINQQIAFPQYIYYYTKTNDYNAWVENKQNVVAQPNINAKQYGSELKIPLPPLETQKKIAAILDEADKLRQLNRQLIEKYDALTQSLFLEMFGDPVTNPKGWEKVKLEKISKITSGSTPSRNDESNFKGKIPWVKTGEVNGTTIYDTSEKISEEALNNSSCKLYPRGSIIIAMYGQGKTRGKCGILGIEAATNQACAVIPPSDKVNFSYMLSLLKLCYSDLRDLGRGGNQPNLNTGLIKKYEVINPPFKLQNEFEELFKKTENQKAQAQASLQKSEALFQSLLQRAFKGELV